MSDVKDPELAEVVVTHSGRSFRMHHSDSADHIFRILQNSGSFYEREFLEAIAPFLNPGDLVLDIGANIGNHTVFFAGVCGARVVAFEPNPQSIALLQQNIAANGLGETVSIEPIALGYRPAEGRIDRERAQGNLGAVSVVPDKAGGVIIRRLDDVVLPGKPRLIKVDVEGMDFDVLRGAERTLREHEPIVTVEAAARDAYAEIAEFLEQIGYVHLQTFNYTPTHLFAPLAGADAQVLVQRVLREMGLNAIDMSALRSKADSQFSRLFERVAALENKNASLWEKTAGAISLAREAPAKAAREMDEAVRSLHAEIAALREAMVEAHSAVTAQAEQWQEELRQHNLRQQAAQQHLNEALTAAAEKLGALQAAQAEAASVAARQEAALQLTDKSVAAAVTKLGELQSSALTSAARQQAAQRHTEEAVAAAAKKLGELQAVQADALSAAARQEQALQHTDAAVTAAVAKLNELQAGQSDALNAAARQEQALQHTDAAVAAAVAKLNELQAGQSDALSAAARQEQALCALQSAQAEALYAATLQEGTLGRIEQAVAAGAETLSRAHRAAEAAVETSVLLGAWLERSFDALRGDILAELRTQIGTELKRELLAALEAKLDDQARLIGAQTADLQIEIDQLGRASALEAPPLRAFFDRPDEEWELGGRLSSPSVQAQSGTSARIGPPTEPKNRGEAHGAALRGPGAEKGAAVAESAPGALVEESVEAPGGAAAAPEVGAESFALGWEARGWAQGGAVLEPGGQVALPAIQDEAGFVSRLFNCASGGVIQVTVEVSRLPQEAELILRVRSSDNENIGPDSPLGLGLNEVRVFAPARTKQVKVYVLARRAPAGASFAVERLRIERLDADAHQLAVRARVGQPVLASMATIPSRREMLADCVASLLAQCDRVRVFLNNYPDVPDFLNHPRVDVRRSQDWDDRGDAGKMFWLDRDKDEGYRLITDDDLIFPPDFAEVMCAKVAAHGDRAIYATHGVLLRQPVAEYYDDRCRAATFHFARRLDEDRAIHIAATNALCLHTSAVRMRWQDFMYCNSADIWLALYAQRNGVPLFTPKRLQNWVRENRHEVPADTIYDHSRKRTRSRFDSSLVQDAVLRFAAPLTTQRSARPKLAVGFLARDPEALREAVSSWQATRSLDVDWVVMLAAASEDEALRTAINGLKIEHETHLVFEATPRAQARAMKDLADRLELDAALLCADAVRFAAPGWEAGLWRGDGGVARFAYGVDASGRLHTLDAGFGAPACVTWLASEARPAPAGWTPGEDWVERLSVTRAPEGEVSAALLEVIGDASPAAAPRPRRIAVAPGRRINDVFERVVLLNLDRRPDRWAAAQEQLARFGISAERFSAVDGADPEVAAEYEAYAAGPLASVSAEIPPIAYSEDFYMRAVSQAARLAHIEQATGKKAIASRGAWGYLRSYERILEQALRDQVESLLVFDDDLVLHKDTPQLFAQAYSELPEDWMILNLGTLQYNWSPPWAVWRSSHLYRTNGSAIGSHAVGMRFDVLPFLLDQVRRMDMPFDVGALSAATHAFAERSFVVFPNIAIQRLADSDIKDSESQESRGQAAICETYRWTLEDYLL